MVKSPYRPTSDSYGDRCGMLVFPCIKHEAITSLWALLEKPFDNLHFLQNISQKIQSLWEYLWGTILMTRSGTFVYMRYASAVGLLPCECEMRSSRTAFSIVTSRRSARMHHLRTVSVGTSLCPAPCLSCLSSMCLAWLVNESELVLVKSVLSLSRCVHSRLTAAATDCLVNEHLQEFLRGPDPWPYCSD